MAPTDEKEVPRLPWDNFSNWVHAICVVTFDLELGQAMEVSKGLSPTLSSLPPFSPLSLLFFSVSPYILCCVLSIDKGGLLFKGQRVKVCG